MAAESMAAMGKSELAELPSDLLPLICNFLELPDLIRFRSVCRQWRLLTSPSAGKQSLWAILPEGGSSFYESPPVGPPPPTPAKFFSLSEGRSYQIPLGSGHHCIGSGFGWLVMAADPTDVSSSVEKLYLLNPITGLQIPLPSTCVPSSLLFNKYFRLTRNTKCVLSSSPTDDDCIVVLLNSILSRAQDSLSGAYFLAYARLGDKKWTCFENDYLSNFADVDVAFHRGHIYVLSSDGDVFSWDFGKGMVLERLVVELPPVVPPADWEIGKLVSTPWGDLLNVVGVSPFKPVRIMKLDFEKWMFTQVEDGYLEEHVIVLGLHTSMCLSSHDFPHLKKNCVYFMGNYWCIYGVHGRFQGYGRDASMGIYSLKDGTSELLDPMLSTWPPPICFIPTSSTS